jgi:hypothetical protein
MSFLADSEQSRPAYHLQRSVVRYRPGKVKRGARDTSHSPLVTLRAANSFGERRYVVESHPMIRSFVLCLALLQSTAQTNGITAQLISVKPPLAGDYKSQIVMAGLPVPSPISLESVSVHGSLQRLVSRLTVRNLDSSRMVKSTEWRVDIYDSTRGGRADRLFLSSEVEVMPGQVSKMDCLITNDVERDKRILPEKAIVLIQLLKVTFQDDSVFKPDLTCEASAALNSLDCKK